jgi:tRNA(Ile2) C34 agmatinyltransferase TiaS
MPYFKCPRCALRAYSAAAQTRCPVCGTPLRRTDQTAKTRSTSRAVALQPSPDLTGRGLPTRTDWSP